MASDFLVLDTIEVKQPFGEFYLVKMKASDMLKICFTDPIRYELGHLTGNQRLLDEKVRVKEIKEYVEGYDAAFPNTIILSANYGEDGLNIKNESIKWTFKDNKIVIPTNQKLASVIDGQHRLFAFREANFQAQEMELACSIYLDLPNALQAFIFATINANQKPVDKSLAYEQFGFDIEKEDPVSWPPDKLAIALYRKFNQDDDSPFFGHIRVAPQIDEILRKKLKEQKWIVSTATVVDGIIRLISTNPKRDKYALQKLPKSERRRSILSEDDSPLRKLYLTSNDIVIYKIVFNYFSAASKILFSKADQNSSIYRTIGIQGLFDALWKIIQIEKLKQNLEQIDFSQNAFEEIFSNVADVKFGSNFFQFSAVGRSNISETILLLNGFTSTPIEEGDLSAKEIEKIQKKKEQHDQIRNLQSNV